jgi:ketol-acid reductoisomerase
LTNIFYDKDADSSALNKLKIGILGYGNQGRSWALNLRDSGIKIMVGNIRDSYWKKSIADGFKPQNLIEVAKRADVLCILIPDNLQPLIYKKYIKPYLNDGKLLVFAHGFAIRYKLISTTKNIDLALLAPRMIGTGVRLLFEKGSGAPAFVAIKQNYTGKAWLKTLALAKCLGFTRVGLFETTFKEETDLDLFTEQAVMPIIIAVFERAYDILIQKGYDQDLVIMELISSGEIIEVFKQICKLGLMGQLKLHSRTSQYGQLSRRYRNSESLNKHMESKLEEISSDKFINEFLSQNKNCFPRLKKLLDESLKSDFQKAQEKINEKIKILYDLL